MSQRSPMNERYRKDAKIGSTRKSAGSAKPVRKLGSNEVSSAASKAKDKSKGKVAPKREALPTSPEIKKWRTIWWSLLLGGLAIIGIVYFTDLKTNLDLQTYVGMVVLALSAAAVYIDLKVIRPKQMELMKQAKKSGKASGKDAS